MIPEMGIFGLAVALLMVVAGLWIGRVFDREDNTMEEIRRLRYIAQVPTQPNSKDVYEYGKVYDLLLSYNESRGGTVMIKKPLRRTYPSWSKFWEYWETVTDEIPAVQFRSPDANS